jgi:FkbH-like protein
VVRQLNAELAGALSGIPDVHMLDYEGLAGEVGRRGWHDKKMWYLARAPLSAAALPAVAAEYARYIAALRRPARKCMVVDLDDTLWGGILGEAGIAGLKLGPDYPGNAFADFQRALRQLKHRGVLLAINSKNNFDDAQEVFLSHPQMILRLEDFAAVRINWVDKPTNMLSIANELNIGLDSFVFADDSPTERDLMRRAVPEILTLELPPNPAEFADVLADSRAFERVTATREDQDRTEMYRAQRERRQAEQSALSLEDFLASLEMKVSIEPASGPSMNRVGELTQKTNQFNLTTRRYTTAQVAALAADPQYGVFHVRVVDRFGDNGIVGVAIVQEKDRCAFIDTFLLSCRVIGRTIETALLVFVEQWARRRGLDGIEGEYIPTAKNAPAADFFTRHGFEQVGHDGNAKRWRLSLGHTELQWPAYMAVTR